MKKIVFIMLLVSFINVRASSDIVMDVDSGRILYENNAYQKRLIASTTKIMTFVVAYEYGYYLLDNEFEAGEEVLKMYGTSIYLNYHEKMTLKDLLYGLMLRSGNDAAVVIANNIASSEAQFVKLMNLKAKELGMHNTIFNNAHGLDEETKNYSTAYDMALLSCYTYKIPLYREITHTKYYKTQTLNKAYSWVNRNKLLFTYKKLTTGKTGYTPSAGKTFVSTASNNNLNLTIVTLNDPNIYDRHKNLYDKYFDEYENYTIVKKSMFNVNKKYSKENIYIKKDIVYPVKKNEIKNLKYQVYINDKVDNQVCGYIEVFLNNKSILKEKIYQRKRQEIKTKSFWQKIRDFFK